MSRVKGCGQDRQDGFRGWNYGAGLSGRDSTHPASMGQNSSGAYGGSFQSVDLGRDFLRAGLKSNLRKGSSGVQKDGP